MKLFGYTEPEGEEPNGSPKCLREVTLIASPSELRKISAFLMTAADAIQARGYDYEHEHLSDKQSGFEASPQFVVFNPALVFEC